MKRYLQRTWVKVLIVTLATLAGAWAVGSVRDTYEVAAMTEKMKTVCVGRMLIDLPMEAKVSLHGARIHGFDIETTAESEAEFRGRVVAREAEISAKPDQGGGNKNMESVSEVKTESGLSGKIFVHSRYVKETTAGYNTETLRRIRYEGVAVEAHLHGGGVSIDASSDDYNPDRIDNLPRLVEQLVANPDNRIPREPGFCVDLAYVRDPLNAAQREQIVLAAGLPSRPDFEIRFETFVGTKPASKGLLERNAASHGRAPAIVNMRFTNLRAAPRTIGGLTGDELVERVIEENFAVIFGFQWEVVGTEGNVLVPEVALTMATGRSKHGPVQSSLSQPAALALWDKISSSVRVRPTAPTRVSVGDRTSPPLGTRAMAGDKCPQGGWWQCSEGGNGVRVLGGQRQYIKQGQRMPQALLLPPQSLWERMRRVQPSFESETPSTWSLADKRTRKRIAQTVRLDRAKTITPPATYATANGSNGEQTAIGARASTGSPCPASGWWRCEESHALDGTRWFAQGNLLPAATFAVPQAAFGRSARVPETIQRRGTWQLLRLAEGRASASGDEVDEYPAKRAGLGAGPAPGEGSAA